MNHRERLLTAALGASVLSAIWVEQHDGTPTGALVDVAQRAPRASTPQPAAADLPMANDGADAETSTRGNIKPIENAFRPVSFLPPPPPPIAPVRVDPPKPVAPPFPFRFFGRMNAGDQETTYLSRDDRLIPIVTNQVIDDAYHVDALSRSEVRITYLPLKEQTVISLPEGR
jgi:hypothetical protein